MIQLKIDRIVRAQKESPGPILYFMYRRPKFLEVLLEIRQEMAREADYDVDLFAEMARSGNTPAGRKKFRMDEVAASDQKRSRGKRKNAD